MALRVLSQEKRAILDSTESGVVAAGAGSGKTTLLARAVYEDVAERRIPVERILVVVFNNAAAAHLVDRIQEEFLAGGRPVDPAIDLSCAWIGTFHSICSRIVRERAHAAGVAPDLVVLDAMESRMLMELALDRAAETCEHPGVVAMLASITDARGAARAVLERQRAAGRAVPTLPVPSAAALDPGALRRAVDAVIANPDVTDKRRETARAASEALAAGTWRGMNPIKGQLKASVSVGCAAYNAAIADVSRALIDRAAEPLLEAFAAFFDSYRDAYERLKRERGVVDFEDLQLLARRVLRDDEASRAAYRFDRVYVDEAQDVNPLQDELIEMLGRDAGRVLRVGDEQQSIYRFRWADVDCFRDAASRTRTFPLRENYRSQQPVLSTLNGWFAGILSGFDPLSPKADPEPVPAPAVELVTVEHASLRATREQEAAEVAQVVETLYRRDRFAWGDIAVLFRARTGIELYERALRAAGVPTVMIGGNVFAEQEQVADALGLLALIENPHDEEELVRVLASPYVAASDDDLLALRVAAGEKRPLWDAIDRVPALAEFGRDLRELRDRRAGMEPGELVERAIAFRGYELAALGLPDGDARYANLRRLVGLAEQFGAVRGSNVREFLRFMQRAVDLGADPGEAVLIDETLAAVRLMTVHAAKGQEFPAVVVADCANRGGGGSPAVIVSQDGARVGVRCSPDGLEAVRAFAFQELCDEDDALGDAEERRISYVALTRAKRQLTVVGRAFPRANGTRGWEGPMGWLAETLPQMPAIGEAVDVQLPAGTVSVRSVVPDETSAGTVRVAPETAAEWEELPRPAAAPAADPLAGIRVSYSAMELHRTCGLRYRLEVELGLPASDRVIAPAVSARAGGSGNRAFGERFHAEMETVDWSAPGLGWDDERAQRLFAVVRDGPVGARLADAAELHLERPFYVRVGAAIVEGIADVWATESGGSALLVDWKTGTLHGPDDPGYALQQAVYALAALRAGAPAVETAWCFLEHDGAVVTKRFTCGDISSLEAAVLDALAGLGRRADPAVEKPAPVCSRCPGLRLGCPVGARGVANAAPPPGGESGSEAYRQRYQPDN